MFYFYNIGAETHFKTGEQVHPGGYMFALMMYSDITRNPSILPAFPKESERRMNISLQERKAGGSAGGSDKEVPLVSLTT